MTEIDPISSEPPLYDVCGWKRLTVREDLQLVAAREEFLTWLGEVPEPHRVDVDARLRSELDHAHLSARLELFVHHYFWSNGWEIQIRPQVPDGPNHPDFLVKREDATLIVECRTVFDQLSIEQQDQRLNQLADNVSGKLGRTVILHPLSDLPPSIPAKRIRSWIGQLPIPDGGTGLLEFDFWSDHQGHHYGVRAIVPKLDEGGEPLTGVHGLSLVSQAQPVTNVHRLRMALQEKANKYGRLDAPYMIAVSGETWSPMSTKDEVDALFGDQMWSIPQSGPVTVTETRMHNGFFTTRRSNFSQYDHVSAVIVYRFKGHQHRCTSTITPVPPGPSTRDSFLASLSWCWRELYRE